MKILISSCLLGINTQWDEDCKRINELVELVKLGKAIFMCPEQLGGLPTPREPSEIEQGRTARDVLDGKGRVLTKKGKDVTKQFVVGAGRILKFCQMMGVEVAILKAKSPSCSSQKTYDGTFTGTKIPGKGVTAELLSQNGIKVYDEENFPNDLLGKS